MPVCGDGENDFFVVWVVLEKHLFYVINGFFYRREKGVKCYVAYVWVERACLLAWHIAYALFDDEREFKLGVLVDSGKIIVSIYHFYDIVV